MIHQSIGFERKNENASNKKHTISTEDLIELGFERELVGRFNTFLHTVDYSKEDLLKILLYSSISSLISFNTLCKKKNKTLIINDDFYEAVANEAYSLNTGARSLQIVINSIRSEFLSDIYINFNGNICLDAKTVKKVMDSVVIREVRK